MEADLQREKSMSSIKTSTPEMTVLSSSRLILREVILGLSFVSLFIVLFSLSACAFKEPQSTIGEVGPQEQTAIPLVEPSPSPKPLPPMSHCPDPSFDRLKEARRLGTLPFTAWLRSMQGSWHNLPGVGPLPGSYPGAELDACERCSERDEYEKCQTCREWQEQTPLKGLNGFKWIGLCGLVTQPGGQVELQSKWADGPPPGWKPPEEVDFNGDQVEGESDGSY